MTREEILQQLNPIFQEVFDDEDLTIDENTTAKDIKEWDSLHHMNLVLAVEEQFDIECLPTEIQKLDNVGGLVELILSKFQVLS